MTLGTNPIKSSTQTLMFYRPAMLQCNWEFGTVDRSIGLQCYSVTETYRSFEQFIVQMIRYCYWVLGTVLHLQWYVVTVASPGFYLTGGTARTSSASISQNSKKYKEWRRHDFISRQDFPIVACRVAWYLHGSSGFTRILSHGKNSTLLKCLDF